MNYSLRRIGPADIGDVVEIMNTASRGTMLQFRLDPAQFLFLSNFWQFSYQHSYIGFVESHPAGVVLNCVDRADNECYSFFWGVVPEFRGTRLSMALVHQYLGQVRQEGYQRAYLDCAASSPVAIYRRLGYIPTMDVVEFETNRPLLRDGPGLPCEEMALEDVLRLPAAIAGPIHWTRRLHFLQRSSAYLHAIGCRTEKGLEAYAIVTCRPGYTYVLDLQCPGTPDAGHAIIRHLVARDYPRPYNFSFVPLDSPAHGVLTRAAFHPIRNSNSMMLDLTSRSR